MFNQFMQQAPMTMSPMPQTDYRNPYLERLTNLQQPYVNAPSPQRMEITRVNGRNGADAFSMPPNSQILLLDETAPIIWLKQTDGAGYATTTPYSITPYEQAPAPDLNSLEDRVKRLEEILSAKPNTSNAKQPKRTGAESNADDTAV